MKLAIILFFAFLSIANSYGTTLIGPSGKDEVLVNAIGGISKNPEPQIDYQTACALCDKTVPVYKQANLYSKVNDVTVSLTVLSKNDAYKLFKELASDPNIPFGYPIDGCFARAHKMVQLMDQKGIISGKAWVFGDIYVDTPIGEVNWWYHVAPIILVQEKDGPVPYVIDPSLTNRPIPFSEWKAIMLKKAESNINEEDYTNRFAYEPNDRTLKLTKYSQESLIEAQQKNQYYLNLQNELQKP